MKQSRRDDLESLCYVLAYALSNRTLPWFAEDEERMQKKKFGIDLSQLRIERAADRRRMTYKGI